MTTKNQGDETMTHSKTTTSSYGDRLSNSLKGIAVGAVLFVLGTVLLFWNEGNYIKTYKAIKEAESAAVSMENVTSVDPAYEGKLVHASALATTQDILSDDLFGVNENAIKLSRKVEYYQWHENTSTKTRDKIGGGQETVTTYTYEKQWSAKPISSGAFDEEAEHKNTILATVDDQKQIAETVTFGAYTLPDFIKSSISGEVAAEVQLTDEEIRQWENVLTGKPQTEEKPVDTTTPSATTLDTTTLDTTSFDAVSFDTTSMDVTPVETTPANVPQEKRPEHIHITGNVVYFGTSPTVPQIGDVRITLTKVLPAEISIIAKVNGSTFGQYTAKNGKTFSSFRMGVVSADKMFQGEHSANTMFMWILRIIGIILVVMSLKMMFSILPSLFKVLPFLGNLVGAGVGLFCFLGGMAWSLLVIAVAWLFYRPLIAIVLLLLVAAAIYGLMQATKKQKA